MLAPLPTVDLHTGQLTPYEAFFVHIVDVPCLDAVRGDDLGMLGYQCWALGSVSRAYLGEEIL